MQTFVRLRFQHRSDAPAISGRVPSSRRLLRREPQVAQQLVRLGPVNPGHPMSSFHRCPGISCIIQYPPLWFNEIFTRLIHWFTMIYIDLRLPSKDDSACTLPWKGYKVPTKVRSNQDRETVPAFWDDQTPTYSQPSTKHWLKDSLTLPWNVPEDPCRSEKRARPWWTSQLGIFWIQPAGLGKVLFRLSPSHLHLFPTASRAVPLVADEKVAPSLGPELRRDNISRSRSTSEDFVCNYQITGVTGCSRNYQKSFKLPHLEYIFTKKNTTLTRTDNPTRPPHWGHWAKPKALCCWPQS